MSTLISEFRKFIMWKQQACVQTSVKCRVRVYEATLSGPVGLIKLRLHKEVILFTSLLPMKNHECN